MYNIELDENLNFFAVTTEFSEKLFNQQMDWIFSNSDWKVFAITATFAESGHGGTPRDIQRRTLHEYYSQLLPTITNRFGNMNGLWRELVPVKYLAKYDFANSYRRTMSSSSPHYVHGLLPIHETLTRRIVNFEGKLESGLSKEINYIPSLCDFWIEEIALDDRDSWIKYVAEDRFCTDHLPALI